jgi:hypothetical protein
MLVTASVVVGTACDSDSVTGVWETVNWAIVGEATKRARMTARSSARLRGIGVIRDTRGAPTDPGFLLNYLSGDCPPRFPSHELPRGIL